MSSTVQTRRSMTKQEDRNTNHRSLSERIRNLFGKKSSSPTRPTTTSSGRESPLSESMHVSTEAPHLKAPNVSWSFGKKKGKVVAATTGKPKSSTVKIKGSRKEKKKGGSTLDISYPIRESEQQTFIQGQNFVSKTPELTYNTTRRTPSTSSYETTIKGFRDFTSKDSPRLSHRVVVPNIDAPTRTSHVSNGSRSPSITRQYDSSPPPISDSEVFSALRQHQQDPNSTFANDQNVGSPLKTANDSNQWKKTSSSSLNKNDVTIDVPKLRAPSVTFGSTSSRKENKRADLQSTLNGTYHSSPTVNSVTQTNRPFSNTYGSLPDSEFSHNDTFNSLKSTKSTLKYPGLSAILEHHFRPTTLYPTERPQRTTRFDTSTTTITDSDQPQQWSTSSIHQQDGYIRPITPQTVVVDDHSSIHPFWEQPVIYRSTTTIYTKEKQSYVDGGMIQTWSIQENDENNTNRKEFAWLQMERQRQEQQSKMNINGFQHSPRSYEQEETQYHNRNYYFAQPANVISRDDAYTQELHRSQTPRDKSEGSPHHYDLKRSDAYPGLGILICADADTRLNHRICDIEPASPGSRVGLRRNDRITHVNGINVENTDFSDLLVLIKQGLQKNNLQFSVLHQSVLI